MHSRRPRLGAIPEVSATPRTLAHFPQRRAAPDAPQQFETDFRRAARVLPSEPPRPPKQRRHLGSVEAD